MLVVLNDNDMSISPPVGALNRYLARLMSGKFYAAARDTAKTVLKNAPPLFELAQALEEHAKGMVVPGDDLRGVRLQLRRPDRRPRPRLADPDAREPARAEGPAVPARRHARRARATSSPRPTRSLYHGASGKFDPDGRHRQAGDAGRSRPSRRSSATGCATWPSRTRAWSASRRRCARAPGMVEFDEALPGALLRRRHRRAARRDLRRRARLRGHEAGGRDLLDLPAARLRPADPRRRDPEPAGRLRARPRAASSAPTARPTTARSTSPTCAASRT